MSGSRLLQASAETARRLYAGAGVAEPPTEAVNLVVRALSLEPTDVAALALVAGHEYGPLARRSIGSHDSKPDQRVAREVAVLWPPEAERPLLDGPLAGTCWQADEFDWLDSGLRIADPVEPVIVDASIASDRG